MGVPAWMENITLRVASEPYHTEAAMQSLLMQPKVLMDMRIITEQDTNDAHGQMKISICPISWQCCFGSSLIQCAFSDCFHMTFGCNDSHHVRLGQMGQMDR